MFGCVAEAAICLCYGWPRLQDGSCVREVVQGLSAETVIFVYVLLIYFVFSELDRPMLEMIGCVNAWNDLQKWLWPDDPDASGPEDSDSESLKLFQLLTSCMDYGKRYLATTVVHKLHGLR